jgi:hypothetical protein
MSLVAQTVRRVAGAARQPTAATAASMRSHDHHLRQLCVQGLEARFPSSVVGVEVRRQLSTESDAGAAEKKEGSNLSRVRA